MKKVSIKKHFIDDYLLVSNSLGQGIEIEINEHTAILIIAELAKYLVKKGAEDVKN